MNIFYYCRVLASRINLKVYSPSTTQLLEEQLRYSDTIILNKTDLIGEEALNGID
jgi:G3E family GTPase